MARPAATIPEDVQPQARALADPTRFRVFRYLLEADRPVDVAELTDYVRLNHNAVRQHLAVLVASELVTEDREIRTRPGRPRLLYRVAPESAGTWGMPGPYEHLATLLSEALRPGAQTEEVGRRAGRRRAAALARATGSNPVETIRDELAQAGFRPTVSEQPGGWELVLGRCPFEHAAAANPADVCAIHLGLARGLAEGLGGIRVERLVPRNPHRAGCRLLLGPTSDPVTGSGAAQRNP